MASHILEQEFSLIPEVEQLLIEGKDKWEVNDAFTIVMDRIEDGIRTFSEFKDLSEDELSMVRTE